MSHAGAACGKEVFGLGGDSDGRAMPPSGTCQRRSQGEGGEDESPAVTLTIETLSQLEAHSLEAASEPPEPHKLSSAWN